MMLGVHFPLDVLGGWFFGALVFLAFVKCHAWIERFAKEKSSAALFITLGAVFILGLALPNFKMIFLLGGLVGLAVGLYVSAKHKISNDLPHKMWKKGLLGCYAVVSSGLVAAFVYFLPLPLTLSQLLQVALSGFWISCLALLVAKKCFPFLRH